MDSDQVGSRTSAAEAIKDLLMDEGVLGSGAYVENCVVVAEVADSGSNRRQRRNTTVYPFGEPDPQVERGLLERALESLRLDGDGS